MHFRDPAHPARQSFMITKSTGKVFTSIAAAVRVPKSVKVCGCSQLHHSCIAFAAICTLIQNPYAQVLDLTQSEDLRCRNVVCEKFDEPCLCRISRLAFSQPHPHADRFVIVLSRSRPPAT